MGLMEESGNEFVFASRFFDFEADHPEYRAITWSSAPEAYDAVLEGAGAFPRDTVAQRSVEETLAGTGSWGARFPDDLMAGLEPSAPPLDSDEDGMPDSWESEQGLDPNDGEDHRTVMSNGYTAIEVYINQVADAFLAGE